MSLAPCWWKASCRVSTFQDPHAKRSPPPPPPPAVIYLWSQIAFFDSAALGADLELKVRWAADIVLQLTAACSFVAFSDEKVLAR